MISLRSIVRTLLVLPLMLATVGCALLTQTLGLDTPPSHDPAFVACQAFKVITFDRVADTAQTIAQIKGHNAAYLALCPPPIRQQAIAGLVPE